MLGPNPGLLADIHEANFFSASGLALRQARRRLHACPCVCSADAWRCSASCREEAGCRGPGARISPPLYSWCCPCWRWRTGLCRGSPPPCPESIALLRRKTLAEAGGVTDGAVGHSDLLRLRKDGIFKLEILSNLKILASASPPCPGLRTHLFCNSRRSAKCSSLSAAGQGRVRKIRLYLGESAHVLVAIDRMTRYHSAFLARPVCALRPREAMVYRRWGLPRPEAAAVAPSRCCLAASLPMRR